LAGRYVLNSGHLPRTWTKVSEPTISLTSGPKIVLLR
jgi:hypothetical protein